MAENHFGEWSIDQKVFGWILSNLPCGSTILEFGSGWVSGELSRYYDVYSLEDSSDYNGKYNTKYIFAPTHHAWYDPEVLVKELPKKYDLILIDGPQTNNRLLMFNHLDLFNWNVPVIFDDCQENGLHELADKLASEVCKRPSQMIYGTGKMTMVIP